MSINKPDRCLLMGDPIVCFSKNGVNFMKILFRHFLKLFIFMPCLMMLAGTLASDENHFRVESLPGVVKQGEVYLIRVLGPASVKPIYAEFRGARFPLDLSEPKGAHEGLIGIDMDTPPSTYEMKIAKKDQGRDVPLVQLSLKVEKTDFGKQILTLPSAMVDLDRKTLERVHQEEKRLNGLFHGFREERLWRGAFILPVEGELSGAFGFRRIINGQPRSPHTGIDLRAKEGTPVVASNSGIVVLVEAFFFSGKSVIIDHGQGFYSMYFHLSETLAEEGKRVEKGSLLGRVGSTGRATGPHLHWGIRMNGARVDPLSLLKIRTHPENLFQQ
jgi:hypothetical protein